MSDKLNALQDRVDNLEDALHQIHTWCFAYPTDFFIEPTPEKWMEIHAALEAIGTNSSAVHGSWARHIMAGIKQICEGVKDE